MSGKTNIHVYLVLHNMTKMGGPYLRWVSYIGIRRWAWHIGTRWVWHNGIM